MTKIKDFLADISEHPGIYQMIDKNGDVIYVGKAKNLKKRVSSYVRDSSLLPYRTYLMTSLVQEVRTIITNSESEAFLLEASLIKKLQPKFNILLKDDKSFPYLKLRSDHEFPQIIKYRGKPSSKDSSELFGPYISAQSLDVVIIELQKIFKIRSCSDNYFKNRKRACLQYQIKRCSAPCVGKISQEDYLESIDHVRQFLKGKNHKLHNDLSQKMQHYSDLCEYEKAAEIRDTIKALGYVQSKALSTDFNLDNTDIIALYYQNNNYIIQLLMLRSGYFSGSNSFFPENTENASVSEILESFISYFYQKVPPPSEIIVSHNLDNQKEIESFLTNILENRVKISKASKGTSRYNILENVINNAKTELEKKLKDLAKKNDILSKIQILFEVQNNISRIELYDNSHISGKFAVGAMVVMDKNGLNKKEYRTFNIKQDQPNYGGDDYAMMREVLTRRLKRLNDKNKPDLIILDGGKGQLNVVDEVMRKMHISIPLVAMSKGEDRNAGKEIFHRIDKPEFTLPRNDEVMKYLQIMRDEVHNLAIKSHRKKRSDAIKYSSLDKIDGIGEKRKKILLNYFGSFERIKDANIEELSKIPNIGKVVAQKIYSEILKKT